MLETTYFYSFVFGGVLLLVQILLSVIGGDADDVGGMDVETDIDFDTGEGSGHSVGTWLFEIISLRTLSAAATFFGLIGIAGTYNGLSPWLTLVLSVAAGIATMHAVYWLFKQMYKLESSGAQDIRSALGLSAEVYLKIPAKGDGMGKVHVEMQGRTVEYLAVSEEDIIVPSGSQVCVIGIVNTETLLVSSQSNS